MYPSDDKEVDEEKIAENELTKEKLELIKTQLKRINRTINNNSNNSVTYGHNESNNQQQNDKTIIVDNNNNNNSKMIVHNPMPPTVLPSTATSANIQNLRLKRFNSLNLMQKTASDKKSNENNNINADQLLAISSSNLLTTSDLELDKQNAEELIANEINNNIKKSLIKYSHFDNQQQQIHTEAVIANDEDEIDDEDDVDDGDDYDQDIDDIAQELLNKSIFISNLDSNNNLVNAGNLIKAAQNKKLLLSSSSATSSAANNYYLQNLNLNDDTNISATNNSNNSGNNRKSYNKKGSLKCVSSADSLISRNNTSSKMLQSAISIQNNSSLDDLTSSSALMNSHKQYTNDNLKSTDVNLTPAPIPAQLDENNNDITEENNEEIKESQSEALSSYLQKHLNFIVSRSTLSSDEKESYQTSGYLLQKHQEQQEQQQEQQQMKTATYKRLPPKFGVLYSNKTTNKLNGENSDELNQKQSEAELAANKETTYSLIQNKATKMPPSLHHPLYQYPTAAQSSSLATTTTTAHLLNPLLFGRNQVTTSTNSSISNSMSTSNTANRIEFLMKSKLIEHLF